MQIIQTPAGRLVGGTTVPALCLDLDGTIRYSRGGHKFIEGPDDVALFPGVEARLWQYRDAGALILGISNQAGVAFGYKTVSQNDAELSAMFALFERNPFHLVKCCFHHALGHVAPYNVRSLLRKPGIGMLALCEMEAFDAGYIIDWDHPATVFVGDREEDKLCAHNAGTAFVWAHEFFGREEPQEEQP